MGVTIALAAAPTAQAAPTGPVVPSAGAAPPAVCTGAFEGDERLGPEHLPPKSRRPVGPLLVDYQRTGELSSAEFLRKYWEGPADTGSWKYPPHDGFAEVNGIVDKAPERLDEGELLDRFGSEYGSYLAPAGDPYAKRALPPQNLNTRDATFPCDYHVYEVTEPFVVWQGSVAPWFEQPGGGQQIKLEPDFLDPGQSQRLNVKWLLEHGYLARVTT
ncbi:TNT domain-containing protein [Streptomyces oceani]|uniref:TNT domain-containing protein n=1 Tax=Streptomyces oceani TaxID=1075402 RepID=A0A1E7KJB2_9ACTN|nr:TNT domain-containing protein [Streptomyces oceani]OEV03973.1 hypothetical protein AN216_09585 [Streptomyces oceani]